jgi:hypothetical protein
MLSAKSVSGTSKKELKKHLRAHLGKGFCPNRQSIDMLAEGHSKVHYGKIEFNYNGKEKAEIIESIEKNIHEEICIYLQRHLNSQSITPSNVERVQAVVGGDHGDTAFQFGAYISVHLFNNRIINFELVCCELICRKDTSK